MEKVSGIRYLPRALTGLEGKTEGIVAAEQSFSPDGLVLREGGDAVCGAMFHKGFEKRGKQRWAERTFLSGLDRSLEVLLKGRCIGHTER